MTCILINLHLHTHKETYSLCVFEVHLFSFHGCMCVVLYALVHTNTHMYNLNHINFLLLFASTSWLPYIIFIAPLLFIHTYVHKQTPFSLQFEIIVILFVFLTVTFLFASVCSILTLSPYSN